MTNGSLFVFLGIVLVVALLLVVVILFTRRTPSRLDVQKYRIKWLQIEHELKRDSEASFTLSVLNADKLLDQALRDSGVTGDTLGERLKHNQSKWSNANNVWSAHKLRNRIAHETDIKVSYNDARAALSGIKQALKDLGAI